MNQMMRLFSRRACTTLCVSLLTVKVLAQTVQSAPTGDQPDKPKETLVLDTFTVTTNKDIGYRAGNAVSAMRMNVPVTDIPMNISVYDKQWIEDIMAFDAADAIAYEPAFINNFPTRSGGQFNIRGFDGSTFLQDGILQNYGFGTPVPLINVERIEVLKGPAGVLYGNGAIGGTINRISKVPQFDAASQYRLIVGSNEVNSQGLYRFEGDWTGSLGDFPLLTDLMPGAKVAYRLNASFENSGLYRVGSGIRETTVAPSLLFQLSPKTSITVHSVIDQTSLTPFWEQPVSIINGKPVYGQVRPDGSVATYNTGEYSPIPDSDKYARVSSNFALAVDLRHSFTNNLQFRSQANYQDFEQNFREYFPDQLNRYAVNIDPATGLAAIGYTDAAGVFQLNKVVPNGGTAVGLDYLLPRDLRQLHQAVESKKIRNEVVWKLSHPYATHNLLVGHSIEYFFVDNYRAQLNVDRANPQNAAPWQLVSVFYGNGGGPINRPRNATVPTRTTDTQSSSRNNWPNLPSLNTDNFSKGGLWEYHASDLISLLDERLFLSVGYRHHENRNTQYNRNIPVGAAITGTKTSAKSDTWSYGVVVHVLKNKSLSLFANANEAFEPVTTISQDGYVLPPVTGEQAEGGLKFELFKGKIGGTVSVYNIKRQNVPVSIATGIFRPNGLGFESKGWEVELNANVTANWQFFAGAAGTKMTDRSRPAGYPVQGVQGVPENSFTLFTRYEFREGPLSGFFGTFGVVYKGDRKTDWSTRPDLVWTIPGEARYDASLGYAWKLNGHRYSATLNAANLTNVDSINKARYWDANPDSLRQIRVEFRAKY